MSLIAYRTEINKLILTRGHARQQILAERTALKAAKGNVVAAKEAQVILQGIAQTMQQNAHKRIAAVVSQCLETVFEDPYKFEIKFERKRGKTEARLIFIKDDNERDPISSAGGGVIDVAAFALRLACLMLSKPPVRRVMLLDEPFKFLNQARRPRIKIMLETLAKEMGVQFVIVTHAEELQIGKVIELE